MTITPKSMPLKSTALQRGLTLVELVAVLAIIGVLTSISVPMYSDYITRSKILAAQQILADKIISLGNYFADNGTYLGASACADTIGSEKYLAEISTPDWKITCRASSNRTYFLAANGISPGLKDSTNNSPVIVGIIEGNRYIANPSTIGWSIATDGGVSYCWPTNKNQTTCPSGS